MIMILAVAAMVMGAMAPASADDAACVDGGIFTATDWDNHGSHVTGGYATPGTPGAVQGGPAHFAGGASPGATFCNQHGSADVTFEVPGNGPPTP